MLFFSFIILSSFNIIGKDNNSVKILFFSFYGNLSDDPTQNRIFLDSLLLAVSTITAGFLYLPLNILMKIPVLKRIAFESAIKNRDFEKLIWRAIRTNCLIQITNSNNKVYIGYVIRTIDPAFERTELRMLPVLSGYRNTEGSIVFKNMYTVVLKKLQNNPIEDITNETELNSTGLADFEIVLPYSEIRHTGLFDYKVYVDTNESFKNKRTGIRKK
ncbi:MAG: hypothetical protein JW982_15755 [Spirochaetes bacterium]|nr:hypothetical protein [Spirochaetota bacterium]